MRAHPAVLLFGALTAAVAPAVAHEFWLEPSDFEPAVGEHVALSLRVGEAFDGDPVPRNEARIVRFESTAAPGSRIAGRDGADPAGLLRVRSATPQVIAYESDHRAIELDAGRFESYLASEGLEHVLEERAARREARAPGRERYARCAKTLLAPKSDDEDLLAPDTIVGLTLELVLEEHPRTLTPGTPLPVRLLFRGEPVEGALVKAWRRGGSPDPRTGRTDPDGRVSMDLGDGAWLVSSVHMIRAADRDDAEWESWWASLTFQRGRSAD